MQPSARIAASIELLSEVFSIWQAGRKAPADMVMNKYFRARRFIGSKDRGAIAELVYFVLRNLGALDWWCEEKHAGYSSVINVNNARQDPAQASRALVIAAILFRKEANVSQLANLFSGTAYGPSIMTEREWKLAHCVVAESLGAKKLPDYARLNFPKWLEEDLKKSLSKNFENEMLAMQLQASVDLRVNTLKTSREELLEKFKTEGYECEKTTISPVGIRLSQREALFASQMFKDGLFEMQDEGSQVAALICDVKPGMRVIDFCAGAGGKTLALAAQMKNKGRILAWDKSAVRLKDLPVRLKRAGVDNVEWKAISSESDAYIKRHKESADRVFVDAPCSGSGTWRRSPDLKWLTKKSDLDELLEIQAKILDSAARLVKPGGRLIYATCSLLNCENNEQLEKFLQRRNDFKVVCAQKIWKKITTASFEADENKNDKPEDDVCFLWLSPHQDGTDGFFAGVLERFV